MGFKNFFESKGYKSFMSKLYGIGAAVVILGALFKIQHYPGAGLMLGLGLGTEALIFFMSAFEPLHVEPDWSLVYPELWGLYHEGEPHPDGYEFDVKSGGKPAIQKASVTQELDKMLEEAKIGPDLIASLGEGMRNLSENALKLSGVASAAGATDSFVANLSSASESVQKLGGVYEKTSEAMSKTAGVNEEFTTAIKGATSNANQTSAAFGTIANALQSDIKATEEYVSSIKHATQSAQSLAEKYAQSAESLTKSAQAIDFSQVDGKSYGDQIQKITKNLSALNAVYELQLQGSTNQTEKVQEMQESVDAFVKNVNASVASVTKYKEQADVLAGNLAALNTVYGNMLAAMNVNVNR
jgi:gliding motility-associated protein GldL